MQPPPNPDDPIYHKRPARLWMRDLFEYLVRARLLVNPDSGLERRETSAGITLRVRAGSFGAAVVKSTGAISARSGSTPGSGDAAIEAWTGSTLADAQAITVRNVTAASVASGKYGLALYIAGTWWGIFEC